MFKVTMKISFATTHGTHQKWKTGSHWQQSQASYNENTVVRLTEMLHVCLQF